MKKAILLLVAVAVAAVIAVKLANRQPETQTQSAVGSGGSQSGTEGKRVFYLFHDPSDQDAGCRRIYAFADRAETELSGKVIVSRPDVKGEKHIVDQYKVRVLPTILVVSPQVRSRNALKGKTTKRQKV